MDGKVPQTEELNIMRDGPVKIELVYGNEKDKDRDKREDKDEDGDEPGGSETG